MPQSGRRHRAFTGIELTQRPTHMLDIGPAFVRGFHRAPRSIKKLHPELDFEINNSL
jgi:hypothetical protein